MAKLLGTESVTLSKLRRTWRVNIETPLGADYVLTAHRENVSKSGDTVLAREPAPVVTRSLSATAAESVTLANGKQITAADLAEALATFIERWETADEAAQIPPASE